VFALISLKQIVSPNYSLLS